MRPDHAIALGGLVLILVAAAVAGAALDRALFRAECQQVVHEPPAPAVRQSDASVVLARDPAGVPALPAPIRPPGSRLERVIEVTAPGGRPVALRPESVVPGECPAYECPDVTVRLDVVRDQVGARRVIATADTGAVLAGIDMPAGETTAARERAHSVGVTIYADGAQAVTYQRRIGRVTGSVSVLAPSGLDAIRSAADVTPGVGVSVAW